MCSHSEASSACARITSSRMSFGWGLCNGSCRARRSRRAPQQRGEARRRRAQVAPVGVDVLPSSVISRTPSAAITRACATRSAAGRLASRPRVEGTMQYEHAQLQPTLICSQPWWGRARRAGSSPVKPSNSKKPCAESESLVRKSARRCTCPGPKATSTNGKRSNTSCLSDCAQQPPTPRRARILALELARLAQVCEQPVIRRLANRARVEEDQIRLRAFRRST